MSVVLYLMIFIIIILFISVILLMQNISKLNNIKQLYEGKIEAYERLLDCSHDLFWIKDREYRLQFVNEEYKKLFPAVSDFVGMTDHDLAEKFLADGYRADDEKVMSSARELHYQENDKGVSWFESTKIPVFKGKDRKVVGCAGIARNITDFKAQESKVYELEHLDYLSGLTNRYSFVTEGKKHIEQCISEGRNVYLVLVHVDRFCNINALNGLKIGDELLRFVSFELRKVAKNFQTQISRVGGDDFCFVMDNNPKHNDVAKLVEQIQLVFSKPFEVAGMHVNLSCSIGVCGTKNNEISGFEYLYRNVELCMHIAKQKNKNRVTYYEDIEVDQMLRKLSIELELSFAMQNDEFYIVYQPKIDVESGKYIGSESLLRWKNKKLGELAPLEFIESATQMKLMVEIGYWQIEKTITQNLEWGACGYHMMPISINLNETQFFDDNLTRKLSELLVKYNYPGDLIEFEISERNFIIDNNSACRILSELHELGVKISIDDFGVDFFSMFNIAKLDIDCIKINQQYLDRLGCEQNNLDIVKSIIALINKHNIKLMVSNVEKAEDIRNVKNLKINAAQGFYYKKPMFSDEFSIYLKNI